MNTNTRKIMYRYIHVSNIKKLIADNGKQCNNGFLSEIDCHVYNMVKKAIKIFNGHHKRLDSTIAQIAITSTGYFKPRKEVKKED